MTDGLWHLPQGWRWAKLREVALTLKAGGTPSRSVSDYWGGEIPFVKIEDITASNGWLMATQERINEAGLRNSSAWLVPGNSVLLTMYASVGVVAINAIPVATNQAIIALVPKREMVSEKFLYYALKYLGKYFAASTLQTTQKNINKRIVEEFAVPLPSPSEQTRIVTQLERLNAQMEQAQAIHRKIQIDLDNLLPTVIRQALQGNL